MTYVTSNSNARSTYYPLLSKSSNYNSYSRASEFQQTGIAASDTPSSDDTNIQAGHKSKSSTIIMNIRGRSISIDQDKIQTLENFKPINISELPEEKYTDFIDALINIAILRTKLLESEYTDSSSEAISYVATAATQLYGSVVVGGRAAATIDNQGVVMSDNELGQRLLSEASSETYCKNGPDLAQARLVRIAKILGGSIIKADTAISQKSFDALPSLNHQRPTPDYRAMEGDTSYNEIKKLYAHIAQISDARTRYLSSQQNTVSINT